MHQVTGNLDQNNRVLIKVGIRHFEPSGPVDGHSNAVSLNFRECTALVDTGARRTCITEKIAQDLGMRRIGEVEVWNVKRPERHWTYLFHVAIWPESAEGLPLPPYGIGDEIEGIDVGNHPYFDVLLGMDIISQGRFLIEPNRRFSLAF
jgi:hypothetical protein